MLIKKENRLKFENTPACTVYEYPIDDKDINVAFVEIEGRYPTEGYVYNELVKELLFVSSGQGKIVVEGTTHDLQKGDAFLIHPKKKYFIEGNLKFVIPCAPAWYPEQHKHFDELSSMACEK